MAIGLAGGAGQVAHAEAFNGPYVGAEAGVSVLERKGSTLLGPIEDSDTAGTAGLVAGYRMPVGEDSPIVLGVEGKLGLNTSGGDARYGVSGIGGVKLGQKALVYLRAGYAWIDNQPDGVDGKLEGVALGGGAEYALTSKVSARLDYRHLDLDDIDFPDNTLSFKGHEMTASVLYNF